MREMHSSVSRLGCGIQSRYCLRRNPFPWATCWNRSIAVSWVSLRVLHEEQWWSSTWVLVFSDIQALVLSILFVIDAFSFLEITFDFFVGGALGFLETILDFRFQRLQYFQCSSLCGFFSFGDGFDIALYFTDQLLDFLVLLLRAVSRVAIWFPSSRKTRCRVCLPPPIAPWSLRWREPCELRYPEVYQNWTCATACQRHCGFHPDRSDHRHPNFGRKP